MICINCHRQLSEMFRTSVQYVAIGVSVVCPFYPGYAVSY
jgi:hypothetical protein